MIDLKLQHVHYIESACNVHLRGSALFVLGCLYCLQVVILSLDFIRVADSEKYISVLLKHACRRHLGLYSLQHGYNADHSKYFPGYLFNYDVSQ